MRTCRFDEDQVTTVEVCVCVCERESVCMSIQRQTAIQTKDRNIQIKVDGRWMDGHRK